MVSRRLRFLLWWRRAGMGLRVVIFLLGAISLSALVYWQRPGTESGYSNNNLLVFLLVNINIILLVLLAFLIGRNIVKLVFDRRRKLLGSSLRLRLVVAFVGLTLIPAAIIFFLASGLLSQAVSGWFNSQVETAITGAVQIARIHYATLENSVKEGAKRLVSELENNPEIFRFTSELKDTLEAERLRGRYYTVRIFNKDRSQYVFAANAATNNQDFNDPKLDNTAFEKALSGEPVSLLQTHEGIQFVRAYWPLRVLGDIKVLLVTTRIAPELTRAINTVNNSYREYQQLKFFKSPLRSGYLLTLAMIAGLIVFAAIWFAFYIAREISGPIQRLAEGTRAVARGNYNFEIRASADDDIGFLVDSFNKMIADLRKSRSESEKRRIYLETILSHLAVGVISINTRGGVTAINQFAERLFSIDEKDGAIGKTLEQILPAEVYGPVLSLIEDIGRDNQTAAEVAIITDLNGREHRLLCSAGQMIGSGGKRFGTVLIFDDITELARAQQLAAWREVARRIAHEIKNPLTPIQLSAQRLQKLLRNSPFSDDAAEAAHTIVEHVSSIKRLANEFSQFARMPAADFKSSDVNIIISDTLLPFAESHPNIVFQFVAGKNLPEVLLDREQIRRVLINLIDNSIMALSERVERDTADAPRIVIRSLYDAEHGNVVIEVSDNGPGIPPENRARVFEPYFTTRQRGTGLGLAIVSSVISEHQGEVKIFDNTPAGVKFVIELPVKHKPTTSRKIAAAPGQLL
ncbi:MAG: HAMP domain-containing protein [Candidatus Dadabacteria bacterium]|nr:MAG: HAMP domain-containing protein [Candidatus Dadabacteria bacterium]